MSADDLALIDSFARVRRHVRGGVVAPNKSLTLLWALDRVDRGEPRLTPFARAEDELRQLLDAHGTPGTAPGYAFWRLQNDGLWEVTSTGELPARSGDKEPRATALRTHASGGFTAPVHRRLAARPALRRRVETLLEDDLDPDGGRGGRRSRDRERRSVRRIVREQYFSREVLAAYRWRCAVCGWNCLHGGAAVALDAAHVWPLGKGGPDLPENGLALCKLHHGLFDAGLFAYDTANRLVVAAEWRDEMSGEMPPLSGYAGRLLPKPVPGHPGVKGRYLSWHRAHVFRG